MPAARDAAAGRPWVGRPGAGSARPAHFNVLIECSLTIAKSRGQGTTMSTRRRDKINAKRPASRAPDFSRLSLLHRPCSWR